MDASLMVLSRSHRRTLADIRSRVVRRSKQNPISYASHVQNDSQAITGWKTDLDKILLVFDVCSVVSVRPALTVCSQTELGSNIYVTVSAVRDGVAETYAIVSEVQRDVAGTHTVVADTHAMVSDIRRKVLGSWEEADDQHRSVSDTWTIPTTEFTLTVTQNQTRSVNSTTSGSSTSYLHLAHQVNYLPRHQGPVSDVPS